MQSYRCMTGKGSLYTKSGERQLTGNATTREHRCVYCCIIGVYNKIVFIFVYVLMLAVDIIRYYFDAILIVSCTT